MAHAERTLLQACLGHPAGTRLYPLMKSDYGLSGYEARGWGEPCSSWSLDPSGGYPFISVPDRFVSVRPLKEPSGK